MEYRPYFLSLEETYSEQPYPDIGGFFGIHFETLFDENEDGNGDLQNLATGKPYDNSTYDGLEELDDIDDSYLAASYYFLPHEENDEADDWLEQAELERDLTQLNGQGEDELHYDPNEEHIKTPS
ncbi:hypothetical protein H0V99_00055 [Candidatus Saccharibacteria bacterium]|nr:hypothetical protein [Candidatus Saccharibacteria bacterium]